MEDIFVGHSPGTSVDNLQGTLAGHLNFLCDTFVGHAWLDATMRHKTWLTTNCYAHQRHSAFTHACFPFPNGTKTRKHTFQIPIAAHET